MARGKAKILKFRNFYEFRMCEQKTGIEIVANPRYQRSLLEKCHILLKTDIFQPKPFLMQFQIELLEVLKSVFLHRSNLSIFGLKSSSDDSKLQKSRIRLCEAAFC